MRVSLVIALLALIAAFFIITSVSYTDTIYLKDGKELRGIVVEDYRDRITFSTADGEKMVMKSHIRELSFDSEEDNLTQLALQAQTRGDYNTAFYYYEKAFKMNPTSKAAKDGMVFLQGYLFRKDQIKKEEDVAKMAEFENYGGAVVGGAAGNELGESSAQLKESLGITLVENNAFIEVSGIDPRSAAWEAGVKRGDHLIAIWSRLTGYMPLREVVDTLLKKTPMETRCTIERVISVAIDKTKGALVGISDLIGCDFSMEFDGLTITKVVEGGIADQAGIADGDLIMAIDGKATRYMSLKKAIEMIKGSQEDVVKLTIRKEVVLWSKTGG